MRLPRFLAATCLAVALPVAGLAMPAAAAQAPRIPDSAYSRSTAPWGPDVSGWNHPGGAAINWSRVRARGASFAFIKASEGTSYASPYFRSDANAARAQGMYAAGYHFARPRLPISTAVTEANYFAARLGNVRGAGWLPPVLDLEVTGGLNATNLTAWTRAFLKTVEQRTGRTPAIYTGYWFWRGYMNNPTGFARYPLWYAAWNSGSSPGSMFGDSSRSAFWQYTDHASIPGIIGNADNNYFHGSRGELAALANVGARSPAPSLSLGFLVAATTVKRGTWDLMAGRLSNGRAYVAGATVSLWRWRFGTPAPVKVGSARTFANGSVFLADKVTGPALYALRVEAGAVKTGSPVVLSRGIVVLTK